MMLQKYLKNLFIYLIVCLSSQLGFGQNAIFVEAGGSAGFGSVNFEHEFKKKEVVRMNYRVGFSFVPIDKNNGTNVILPFMVNAHFGRTNHKVELGVGQTLSITTKGSVFLRTPLLLGYRYSSTVKPWFVRLSYTPIISNVFELQYEHWAGISVGWYLSKKTKKS